MQPYWWKAWGVLAALVILLAVHGFHPFMTDKLRWVVFYGAVWLFLGLLAVLVFKLMVRIVSYTPDEFKEVERWKRYRNK